MKVKSKKLKKTKSLLTQNKKINWHFIRIYSKYFQTSYT